MGFYHGPSTPPSEDEHAGFRETVAIIWAAFSVLALPLALIFGVVLGMVLLVWLFTIHVLAGFGALAAVALALLARGWWEARHPPDIG